MYHMKQSLKIISYEGARVGTVPDSETENVNYQCETLLEDHGITAGVVTMDPADPETLNQGDYLTVTVSAPFSQNCLGNQHPRRHRRRIGFRPKWIDGLQLIRDRRISSEPASAPSGWDFGDPVPPNARWLDLMGAVQTFIGQLKVSPGEELLGLATYNREGKHATSCRAVRRGTLSRNQW